MKVKMQVECQGRSEHLCSGTVPGEVCAAVLVFAHRVAILHNPQSQLQNPAQSSVTRTESGTIPSQSRLNHAIQSNRQNHDPCVGGCGIALDLMVSRL